MACRLMSTASGAKSVCDSFEFCRRRQNLTFSHHQEVQGREDADELLDWCEETGNRCPTGTENGSLVPV